MLYLAVLQAWLFFSTNKATFLNMINDITVCAIRFALSFAMLLLRLYHEIWVISVINLPIFLGVASLAHMEHIIFSPFWIIF